MLVEPKLAGRVACLLLATALTLSACSASNPRDIRYGTDAAVGFVPPDAGPDTSDGSPSEIDGAVDMEGADAAGSLDGENQIDLSLDTNS